MSVPSLEKSPLGRMPLGVKWKFGATDEAGQDASTAALGVGVTGEHLDTNASAKNVANNVDGEVKAGVFPSIHTTPPPPLSSTRITMPVNGSAEWPALIKRNDSTNLVETGGVFPSVTDATMPSSTRPVVKKTLSTHRLGLPPTAPRSPPALAFSRRGSRPAKQAFVKPAAAGPSIVGPHNHSNNFTNNDNNNGNTTNNTNTAKAPGRDQGIGSMAVTAALGGPATVVHAPISTVSDVSYSSTTAQPPKDATARGGRSSKPSNSSQAIGPTPQTDTSTGQTVIARGGPNAGTGAREEQYQQYPAPPLPSRPSRNSDLLALVPSLNSTPPRTAPNSSHLSPGGPVIKQSETSSSHSGNPSESTSTSQFPTKATSGNPADEVPMSSGGSARQRRSSGPPPKSRQASKGRGVAPPPDRPFVPEPALPRGARGQEPSAAGPGASAGTAAGKTVASANADSAAPVGDNRKSPRAASSNGVESSHVPVSKENVSEYDEHEARKMSGRKPSFVSLGTPRALSGLGLRGCLPGRKVRKSEHDCGT